MFIKKLENNDNSLYTNFYIMYFFLKDTKLLKKKIKNI